MHQLKARFSCLLLLLALAAPALAEQSPIRAMPPSVAPSVELPVWQPSQRYSIDPLPPTDAGGIRPVSFDVPLSCPIAEPRTCWSWQVVPEGLMYRSYLAGVREPRIGVQLFHEPKYDWLWDASVGGRIGLLRYGTHDPLWAEGWQIDAEAAAFPRLSADADGDLISADYRYGFGLTHRRGRLESKLAYYHLSSHLGDEYQLSHPWISRINFSRFAFVLGAAFYPWDNVRAYAEADFAFHTDGGTEPWAFQFGIDYSPLCPSRLCGAPFFAVSGHLREEVDFGGNFTLQTGWQWRGTTGRLARIGFHYLNGQSNQYQFFREHEQQVGIGFWYDF